MVNQVEHMEIIVKLHLKLRCLKSGLCEYRKIKDYNVKIGARNIFYQPIKNNIKHIKTLEKLILVKGRITQLVVY